MRTFSNIDSCSFAPVGFNLIVVYRVFVLASDGFGVLDRVKVRNI